MIPSSFPSDINDHAERLRILWVEDKVTELLRLKTLGNAADELVHLVAVGGPNAAWELVNNPDYEALMRDGFDAYLTDFRLYDSHENADTDNARERTRSTEIASADEERGLFAQAAGFLIGIFVSLRFTGRPSIVLPYSAHADEFGDIWRLVRSFAPDTTRIAEPNQINKVETAQVLAIRVASASFRETLLEWAREGKITIDTADLAHAITACKSGRVPNKTPINIFGRQIVRRIYVGSLFLGSELTLAGVPLADVQAFIDSIPALGERHKAAREVAQLYIALAEAAPSRALFDAAWKAIDEGRPLPEHVPPARAWLGVQGDDRATAEARRNGFLLILIHLHAKYMLPIELLEAFEQEDDSLPLRKVIDILTNRHTLEAFSTVRDGLLGLISQKGLDPDDSLAMAIDDLNRLGLSPAADRRIHLERLIQQYVNPAPESAQTISARILAEARIGKGLLRLLGADRDDGARDGKRGNRLNALLEGRPCLPFDALEVPLAYARKVIPHSTEWPRWLTPVGPGGLTPSTISGDEAPAPPTL